jgi:hypothetical protein
MDALQFAIDRVFSQWTVLRFAVEQGTAGNPRVCMERRNDLLLETIEYLQKGADEAFIADLLFGRIEEDFFVTIEDESDRVVARMICELYHRIIVLGDLAAAKAVPVFNNDPSKPLFQGDFSSSSCSEDEADECPTLATSNAPRRQEPDEDGWFTVPKRK